MSSKRPVQDTPTPKSIESAAQQWREMYKALEEVKGRPHSGAAFLSYYGKRVGWTADRLLELGLDVSDLRNPRVVPVPTVGQPKTKSEARRWDAETNFRVEQLMLSYSVTGVGTHVVHSNVGDGPLVDALAAYASDDHTLPRETIAAAISRPNLEYLALACAMWLLEPTGPMKASAADLDATCFNRMLYAFEINPLTRVHRQARDDKLTAAERVASTDAAAGWSVANLSLSGKPGAAIRQALDKKGTLTAQYERFLNELPSASLIAWEDREPSEPLRSTGNRDKNLARRVAAVVEQVGNEDATRPGKLVRDTPGTAGEEGAEPSAEHHAAPDPLLEEFELRETARQELAQLRDLGR